MAVYGESLAMPEDSGFDLQDGWSSRLKSVFSSRKEIVAAEQVEHTGHHNSPKPEVALGGLVINQGVIPHTKRNGQIDESHPGYNIGVYHPAAAILEAKQL